MKNEHEDSLEVTVSRITAERSVVLPIYGEDPETVESLVNELFERGWDEVILAVDSPTPAMQASLDSLDNDPRTKLTVHDKRRGKGGAIRSGLSLASGSVFGYVDADGAIPVAELERLYETVERDSADVAVGSRDVGGQARRGQSIIRRGLARCYRVLAGRVIQADVHDVQCGAKAFSAKAWDDVGGHIGERGFAFDTELIARFARADYDIREVGIDWREPGDSSVALGRDAIAMLLSLATIASTLISEDAGSAEAADSERVTDTTAVEGRDSLDVALVSSHPPNRGHLAEYGEELAVAYAERDDVEPTGLARRFADAPHVEQYDGYEIRRIWKRDSVRGAFALLRELRRGDYDVVQFNIHMTYFGHTNHHRFVGLALPPLVRLLLDVPVVTTMHDMLEVVEKDVIEENASVIERVGAKVATQLVLLSNVTTVTSAQFRDIVTEQYICDDVRHVPHGTFERADGGIPPIESPLRVMVFGHLGPNKDVETVVRGFEIIREEIPDAELVIAGDSHPGHPGYREQLEAQFDDVPGVEFLGYVEQDDLQDVWTDASLVVMPYRTCTGVSGVYQLAKSYGRPVVVYDVESMHTSTIETGGAAEFVPPNDPDAMAATVVDLWRDRARMHQMALKNANAGTESTIDDTAATFVEIMRSQEA